MNREEALGDCLSTVCKKLPQSGAFQMTSFRLVHGEDGSVQKEIIWSVNSQPSRHVRVPCLSKLSKTKMPTPAQTSSLNLTVVQCHAFVLVKIFRFQIPKPLWLSGLYFHSDVFQSSHCHKVKDKYFHGQAVSIFNCRVCTFTQNWHSWFGLFPNRSTSKCYSDVQHGISTKVIQYV